MKKFLCLLLFVLSACSARPEFETGALIINNVYMINIEIAETTEQKSYGLMNKKNLSDNYGMLFVYEDGAIPVMWMKNTYVSLDMFFINRDGIIYQIEKNTEPLSLTHIKSKKPVKYVLETKAGLAERLKLKIGDKINFLEN